MTKNQFILAVASTIAKVRKERGGLFSHDSRIPKMAREEAVKCGLVREEEASDPDNKIVETILWAVSGGYHPDFSQLFYAVYLIEEAWKFYQQQSRPRNTDAPGAGNAISR